jgi:hypothetical protein
VHPISASKQPSLTPAVLHELDDVNERPTWLSATITQDGTRHVLVDAVALYWGVRRLIFDHTSRPKDVKSLHRMIEDTWRRKKPQVSSILLKCASPGKSC